jgi:hypothetical protein
MLVCHNPFDRVCFRLVRATIRRCDFISLETGMQALKAQLSNIKPSNPVKDMATPTPTTVTFASETLVYTATFFSYLPKSTTASTATSAAARTSDPRTALLIWILLAGLLYAFILGSTPTVHHAPSAESHAKPELRIPVRENALRQGKKAAA